ncbi:MAG: hypothetical protein PHW04_13610 [Candidatus Wallbacteria bacterium]|nr:hypothetical protein [Candidatus Wallbacteria bacterium]
MPKCASICFVLFSGLTILLNFSPAEARTEARRYAIVVENGGFNTGSDTEGWLSVLNQLKSKYNARVFWFEGPADKSQPLKRGLSAYKPYYVCFITRPDHCDEDYVQSVIRLMESIDDDPYDDAIWAILTGYDYRDALRIVKAGPLTVRRELSHLGNGWMDPWIESGVSFNEGVQGSKFIKEKGKSTAAVAGPADTTAEWVRYLNHNDCDVIVTSGHATEFDWRLGYAYKDGKIIPADRGRLKGVDLNNCTYEITTTNPKIYYGPGNCLIAHIPAKTMECMALSWIHNGANQFYGHIEPQYRNCTAWGVWNYFATLRGAFTFAEAVYANRVASRYLVKSCWTGEVQAQSERCLGITVLYGDPAWAARVKKVAAPDYEMKLTTVKSGTDFCEITACLQTNNDLKFNPQYSKPPVFLLPFRIRDWKIKSTDFETVEVTDNFILADTLGRTFRKGELLRIVVDCRIDD